MRIIGRLLVLLFILVAAVVAAFIVVRATGGQEIGPAVALCPGPDEYGYICSSAVDLGYIDASFDTMLYEDDGLAQIELPFTFTFYGTGYDAVVASSNGNLQFTTEKVDFDNRCLVPEPAPGMGDMIAPYWDDLNLTFAGFLQTQVVGTAPQRVFVIEWDDVPRINDSEDRVTFEVQLFEGSNDIVFLYQDVRTIDGPAGSQATIGIQSEEQGYALQVSCDQYAVYDGNSLQFVHPDQPPVDAGLSYVGKPGEPQASIASPEKGIGASVVKALNAHGMSGLETLKATRLNERPRLRTDWLWADMESDGDQELIVLSQGVEPRPELAELAVIGRQADGRWQLRWQTWPLARQEKRSSLALAVQGDLTGDGEREIVLRDLASGNLLVVVHSNESYDLHVLPGGCGSATLGDENGDGIQEIVRARCRGAGRLSMQWDGESFVVAGDR